MKTRLNFWLRIVVLFIELLLLVGAVAFPLVFSEAVLANFMAVLQLVARLS